MARKVLLPLNAWDSHMHVVNPAQYLLVRDAQYVPSAHTLSDAVAFESGLGLRNIVLVQPSIYGNDNSCLLDALQSIGPRHGRGVVQFNPYSVTKETLESWHEMGVRGVRLNLKSTGQEMEISAFEELLREYARRISLFGWVLQLYVPLSMVAALELIVPQLGVKVCLDHFAHPSLPYSASTSSVGRQSPPPVHTSPSPLHESTTFAGRQSPFPVQTSPSPIHESATSEAFDYDPYDLPGFTSLVSLLRQGSTFVKVSAAYRISSDPELRDLQPVAAELLRVAGKSRLVFATDWPHTRFEGLDIGPFVEKVIEWCRGDEELIERVFRGNAEDLWDVAKQ